jgi:hypothetical protein
LILIVREEKENMRLAFLKSIATIILCLSLVVGCTTAHKLNNLSLGLTASEVVSLVGEPGIAREPIANKYGQVLELWHYEPYNNDVDAYEPYFLYFYEGKLVQWGKAVYVPRERIYETKF